MKEGTDFWWLPSTVDRNASHVGLGHHRPLKDKDNPCSVVWCCPFDMTKDPSDNPHVYPIDFLKCWRDACNNTNVYRTLKVFEMNSCKASFLGPFIVDIDNSARKDGYEENLEDALQVARQVADFLTGHWGLTKDHLHIFFSGRKGFNFEVHPECLSIKGTVADQVRLSAYKLDEIIRELRKRNKVRNNASRVSNQETVIDRIYGDRFGYRLKHPYIRLHRSINKWIGSDGKEMARMRIELSLEELDRLSVKEICTRAESLSSNPSKLL